MRVIRVLKDTPLTTLFILPLPAFETLSSHPPQTAIHTNPMVFASSFHVGSAPIAMKKMDIMASDSDFAIIEAGVHDFCLSTRSSSSSIDEDEDNRRMTPHWPRYRHLIQVRGFYLDTFRRVKEFYTRRRQHNSVVVGYHQGRDDDDLCRDPGLVRVIELECQVCIESNDAQPDNLFRGSCINDGAPVVIKAVHLHSRELQVIRYLSSLRADPMNHCIPVLDLILAPMDNIGFIVMEEWSSQLITDTPCCLSIFLQSIRQCIENTVFMHRHHIAHLDISLRNVVSDYKGHYAFIDFELSHHYVREQNPQVKGIRGTEIPPELERGESSDPYKVDIWALAVMILRACKLTGYEVPELMHILNPMLRDRPELRPPADQVLKAFDIITLPLLGGPH